MLYFFVSYARGDEDPAVQQFFHDLSVEVRVRAGLHRDAEVGFLDARSLLVGAPWASDLVQAISTCQSFIALCSPRYFLSEPCGREWTIFADRLQAYEQMTGILPPALLPVFWLPPERLPEPVQALQYDSEVLPEAYRRAGLRQMLRLRRHHDSYREFVFELAGQIVDSADRHTIPQATQVPDFDEVQSEFHKPQATPREDRVDRVTFAVAAPTTADLDAGPLAELRRDRRYYGHSSVDWRPYHPAMAEPIASYASVIAAERGFESNSIDVTDLRDQKPVAWNRQRITVFLIDPWALLLSRYREALSDLLHAHRAPAVMMATSHEDQETYANRAELARTRTDTLPEPLLTNDVLFRPGILTHTAFGADLEVVLEIARNRVFAVERPILKGPK